MKQKRVGYSLLKGIQNPGPRVRKADLMISFLSCRIFLISLGRKFSASHFGQEGQDHIT